MRIDILTTALYTVLAIVIAGSGSGDSESNAAMAQGTVMSIETSEFGKAPDGKTVTAFHLTNSNGLKATLIDWGAVLVSLEVPDRNGNLADVVLGCDTVECYNGIGPYLGATIGRYGNRIAKGKFTLDGTEYTLVTNNGPNHLHGGEAGFDKRHWRAQEHRSDTGVGVRFDYTSADMEEGYPGNLSCKVIYTLTNDNEVKIEYVATTDKATPINLTNHSYWNFRGHDGGDILGHVLTLYADKYNPVDETSIPTGKLAVVEGTPMDFRAGVAIGARIADVEGGYDHNYVLNKTGNDLSRAAKVVEPETGRVMEIFTTEPGIQFYTGNYLDASFDGKDGKKYPKHGAFCLETQKYPDSPNQPGFPTSILRPGETYSHVTVHKFSTE